MQLRWVLKETCSQKGFPKIEKVLQYATIDIIWQVEWIDVPTFNAKDWNTRATPTGEER